MAAWQKSANTRRPARRVAEAENARRKGKYLATAATAGRHAEFGKSELQTLTVPKRWVKALVGLFLLPFAWITTQTFFGALAWATIEKHFWLTEEFWFFGLGSLLWCVIFFTLPRPIRVYVLGHELTHALAVWMMGGRVEEIRVHRDGGHVIADKVNTLVALAPYFVPLYSLLVLAAYLIAAIFTDAAPFYRWMLGALGFTWAFHITFTCSMIKKGQSDLTYGGQFFSLVVIYLANLTLLSALLIIGAPHISAQIFFDAMLENFMAFMHGTDTALHLIFDLAEKLISRLLA